MADSVNQSLCDELRDMLVRNKAIVAGKRRRADSLRARIAKLKADPETIRD